MAIDSYTALRGSLAAWIHQADAITHIPDFIALAEARITADLMSVRPMWQRSRATLSSGSSTIATPDDCMSFVGCALVLSGEIVELPVVAITSAQFASTSQAQPTCCAVAGETLHLSPPADQTYTLEMIYHRRLPALGDSVASNWVLETAPQLYLYGALLESVGFTNETAKVPQWSQMYENALSRLTRIGWEGPTRLISDVPVGGRGFDISRGF